MTSPIPSSLDGLLTAPRQIARHLLVIGGNRIELLAAEAQEGRDRVLYLLGLVLGVAMLGLVAVLSLVAALVIAFWSQGPVLILLLLATGFAILALGLYRLIVRSVRTWELFRATIDQLHKDRDCLAEHLP